MVSNTWGVELLIFLPQGMVRCDTRTFLSGTRRALKVARVSVSHAASHSIFIGVNIQLTSESLVRSFEIF